MKMPFSADLLQVHEAILGYVPNVVFDQDELPSNFPLTRWNQQIERYQKNWRIFLGDYWEETIANAQTETGEPVKKYPLEINLVQRFATKHASVLLGEIPDTDDAAVKVECSPIVDFFQDSDDIPEEDVRFAQSTERFLNYIWSRNAGRAAQVQNALLCQFLGGCYFKVGWWPQQSRSLGITVEPLIPDVVLPVWDTANDYRIIEAYIAYKIPAREAKLKYGFEASRNYVVYVEHWTRDTYSIFLDKEPLTTTAPNGSTRITYNNLKNPFGMVPIEYIPRLRVGGFYGLDMVRGGLLGINEEYNHRAADFGDAIQRSVNRQAAIKNTRGVTAIELPDGTRGLNLGFGQMNQKDPDIQWQDPPNLQGGIASWPEDLFRMAQREGGLSNIAFGEDEGSQRSALTLAFRMWPTTSLARLGRAFWTIGLNNVAQMILQVGATRLPKYADSLRRAMDEVHISQSWAPMIPRDREQVVNEAVLLKSANIISIRNAIERLGDVKDPAKEEQKVWEDLERLAELNMLSNETDAPPGTDEPQAEAITGDG